MVALTAVDNNVGNRGWVDGGLGRVLTPNK